MSLVLNRADLLERLRLSLGAPAPEGSPEALFADFVLAVARSVDLATLERQQPEVFAASLARTLEFSRRRVEGTILVRVVHEGGSRATLESCMRDQPFLYDSLRMLFEEIGVSVAGGFHSVVSMRRDEGGHLLEAGRKAGVLESVMRLELEGVPSAADAAAVEAAVGQRFALVRAAVRGHQPMRSAVEGIMDRLRLQAERHDGALRDTLNESLEQLGWLLDDNFIFMAVGYLPATQGPRAQVKAPEFAAGLGTFALEPLLADDAAAGLVDAEGAPVLSMRVVDAMSRIHRKSNLDRFLVRCFDARGAEGGLAVIEGIFAYRGLSAPRDGIPMLARMGQRLLTDAALPADSYRGRLLRYAFAALPLEYLLSARYDDVHSVVERVAGAAEGQEAQVAFSVDSAKDAAWVFVALPSADYDDELSSRIADALGARFGSAPTESAPSLSMQDLAVLHYRVRGGAQKLAEVAEGGVAEIRQLLLPWHERVRAALERKHGVDEAARRMARYQEAFPDEYRRQTPVARVVADIDQLERLSQEPLAFDLFIAEGMSEPTLRIYERDDYMLSDLLPVLEHFGLRISSQYEVKVTLPGGRVHAIDSFIISGARGVPNLDLMAARERLLPAVAAVFGKRFTDSPLNALLLRAEVTWRDVGTIRSYLSYARQLGFRFPPGLVQDVLLANAEMVRLLVQIFHIKFDPRRAGTAAEREVSLAAAREEFLSRLDAVADYSTDSILRSLLNLVDATLRTNLYCRGERTDNLALKFDCSKVELLQGAGPQPMFEIFVHHRAVHGVHLRGGKVARGGLRWSDRLDDYRTEILGLMRTQMVKNAIIVPVGAKGGFVLQEPVENPKHRRAQADEGYKVFVSALLDVTDNIVDGKVTRPAEVVCYDEEDPYLVVAADKGTAHLSDVANSLSRERGFWLADAFASGGSAGYDHKVTGITAKGAWVCARRHLRELGIEPDRDVMTVVGIGDMSGDVFGNGLMLSRNFKLLAAFDHRHIFLDPDPDPERSWAERCRLFALPGSSWDDYDKSLISAGGGVFSRAAKEVPLSPELRARFGVDVPALSGEAMIRAILTLDVDLLWNGGIGTYFKASEEDHREAGDRTNDMVRVDAKDVRAKVIGEGGNLGMTQLARLEYQSLGGRCNTDAFDNSGGVDLSDHEVNIKILFAPIVRAGRVSQDARDLLMREAEPEVVQAVLDNNRAQSRQLSLDERRSRRAAARFARAVSSLARTVPFDARQQKLPNENTLRARTNEGRGMYRPELALLSGFAKIYLTRQLLAEAELDPRSPRLWPLLLGYFPRRIADAYRNDIAGHLLAREIGFTVLTNLLIGDVGVSFFPELEDWSGRSTSAVASAYLASSEAAGAWAAKEAVRALEGSRSLADVVYPALLRIEDAVEAGAVILLSGLGGRTLETPTGAANLLAGAPGNLPQPTRHRHDALVATLAGEGLPDALARKVAAMELLVPALIAGSVAEQTGIAPELAFDALFAAGEATRLLELERRIALLPAEARADAGALRTLRLRFTGLLARCIAQRETGAARAAAIASEVGRALREEPSIASLVTLEDRLTRLVAS